MATSQLDYTRRPTGIENVLDRIAAEGDFEQPTKHTIELQGEAQRRVTGGLSTMYPVIGAESDFNQSYVRKKSSRLSYEPSLADARLDHQRPEDGTIELEAGHL